MKITEENIKSLPIESGKRLLKALLKDLEEINQNGVIKLYIDWIDKHTEYSPERVDPCPDYYGMYRIVLEDDPRETIGVEMTLEELDVAICALSNYIEYL